MENRARLEFIDSMRAVAALMVVLLHAVELTHIALPGAPVPWIFREIVQRFDFGRAGVVLFFAISGFVIPSSLGPRDPWFVFPVRRAFRLYPAYWISLPAALIAIHWLHGDAPTLALIGANATMMHRFFGIDDLSGVYWTLQVELAFYGVCFALHKARVLDSGRFLAGASLSLGTYWLLVLASGLGRFTWFLPARPHFDGYYLEWFGYFSIMFLGASCRRIFDGDRTGLPLAIASGFVWLILEPAVGLSLYAGGTAREFVALKYGAYAIGLSLAFLLTYVGRLHSPTLAACGRASYSLYLLHLPVICAATAIMTRVQLPNIIALPFWIVAEAAAALGAAYLSYRWIEKPAVRFGGTLIKRLHAHK